MKPRRNARHLQFIRSLPCLVCGRRAEAAHVGTNRGMAQKCSDLETCPLCQVHHREQHRVGLKRFCVAYELDLPTWIEQFTARPKFVVWEGRYIAHWSNEVIALTLYEYGFTSAWICFVSRAQEILTDRIQRRVRTLQRA
jgi:hypothetical protein